MAYNPHSDALLMLGWMVGMDEISDEEIASRPWEKLLQAETKEDLVSLIEALSAIAAGFAQALTPDADPRILLQRLAVNSAEVEAVLDDLTD